MVSCAVGGVDPLLYGDGPCIAIPKALNRAGLVYQLILTSLELEMKLSAAQAVAVIQEARLDPKKVNVNGGAIALGHPLGCSWRQEIEYSKLIEEMKNSKSTIMGW